MAIDTCVGCLYLSSCEHRDHPPLDAEDGYPLCHVAERPVLSSHFRHLYGDGGDRGGPTFMKQMQQSTSEDPGEDSQEPDGTVSRKIMELA